LGVAKVAYPDREERIQELIEMVHEWQRTAGVD